MIIKNQPIQKGEEKIIWDNSNRIQLTFNGQTHPIGEMVEVGDTWTFYKRVNRDKHYFRKLKAYGINYLLISSLNPDTQIVIDEIQGDMYKTTAGEIVAKGKFLNFKREGYELQIFLPLEEWRRA